MTTTSIFVFLFGTLVAMVPVVETQGAIPLAMSTALWGDSALNALWAWTAATLGGILVCFIAVAIFLPFRKILEKWQFSRKILQFIDKKMILWLDEHYKKQNERKNLYKKRKNNKTILKNEENIEKNNQKINFVEQTQNNKKKQKTTSKHSWKKALIVFIFCALPVPFSGVWSAAALCSVLKLGYFQSVLALAISNTFNTILIGLFCFFLDEFIDVLITAMLIIFVLFLLYHLFKAILLRLENKKEMQSNEIIEK